MRGHIMRARLIQVSLAVAACAVVAALAARPALHAQQTGTPGTVVKVALKNVQGQPVGTATLTPFQRGVRIALDLVNLTPGEHGIHFHQTPQCAGQEFAAAGGHLNPENKEHGLSNPKGPHAGDIPNITVDANGKSSSVVVAQHITMGSEPNSIYAGGGTALIIHAMKDDGSTQPSGNAGARVACGEIIKKM